MSRVTKWTTAVAGVAVATLAMSACTGPAGGGASNGTASSALNVYLYQEPSGIWSPLATTQGADTNVMSLIYERLLDVSPDYKLTPRLADSYTVSPDGTTFTFKLKQGLKWSDGTPFTSKDVLFTYNALANPKTTSTTAAYYQQVAGVKDFVQGKASTISGFSAPDDNTFVIKAASPDMGLVAQIGTVWILPEHILGKDSPDTLAKDPFFKSPTVGMGPYQFVEYKPNQYVHLKKNTNYATPVAINDVYLKSMTSDASVAALGNGGLDIASYQATDKPTVDGFKSVTTEKVATGGYVRINANIRKPYLADPRVRQAFLYAFDREAIVQKVLNGLGAVQLSAFYNANAPSDLNPYKLDVAKAKQLLADAGWDPNRELTLKWIPGQRDRDSTVTIFQSSLAAVGVKVKLVQTDPAAKDDLKWDLELYGGGNYAVDSWTVNAVTACANIAPAGGNNSGLCDPQLDTLMAQANGTADDAKRKELYDQAARLDNKDVDQLWLYNPTQLWASNKRVQGFKAPGSQDAGFFQPDKWSVAS